MILFHEKIIYQMGEIANEMKRILSDDGQIFLNVGYSNIDPFVAMDVAQEFRKYFVLQNQFVWVKHIAVNDTGYGQYKPIIKKICCYTENIFTSRNMEKSLSIELQSVRGI